MATRIFFRVCLLLLLPAVFAAITSNSSFSSQLQEMIINLTKKPVSDYESYGCWCNSLNRQGDDPRAVDENDRCCRQHSDCYSAAAECSRLTNEYDAMLRKGNYTCMDSEGTCEHSICQCDKQMAECLKKYRAKYDGNKYSDLTEEQCQDAKCSCNETASSTSTKTPSPPTTTGTPVCEPFQPPPPHSNCAKPKWSERAVTIAGNGKEGSSNTQLAYPYGIFVDSSDALYVTDYSNHRVQKFVQGSTVGITVAGGKGEGNGDNQLDGPGDVYVDPTDNIFIVDWGNKRIQMWPVNSTQGTTIANITDPWESFHGIHGNNRASEVYITENTLGGGSKVLRYSSSGIYETIGVSAAEDTFLGLYVDQCDNVYVTNSNSTLKFSGGNTTRAVLINSFHPADVTLDQYGNLYVVEHNQCRVKRLSVRDGTSEIIINKSSVYGTDDEHLSWPRSLALDSKGNVYVSDSSNNRVQKFLFESGDLFC